ncbi:hypothetical protein N7540_003467 [Penicillium herquei]|nr:hypothetical protein N7540_003467 [Penicillium herquei]
MTRVAGKELGQSYDSLTAKDKESILQELKGYLEVMRRWRSPWGENRICSIIGTPIRRDTCSARLSLKGSLMTILLHPLGQVGSSLRMNITGSSISRKEWRNYTIALDLKSHNIMVDKGRITGFLDWESAGWSPELWDFTTALRFTRQDFWWYKFVLELGGDAYLTELECERALTSLTSASYCG